MSAEAWFRYEEIRYSLGVDEYGDVLPGRGRMELRLHQCPVTKTTPRGVWIEYYGDKKFVLQGARKRFACPTIEEAKASFIARKERQSRILSAQLEDAEEAIRLAKKISSVSLSDFHGDPFGLCLVPYPSTPAGSSSAGQGPS